MYKPLMNNQIKAKEVRVIDNEGNQLGVLSFFDAMQLAREKELDLIQVTEKVDPPVCKIMEYGKYVYQQKKKEKVPHHKGGEIKGIRLSFAISDHDMEVRAKQAEKFFKIGDKVRVEMRLKGREKAHFDFAREKITKFVEILKKITPVKIEIPIKKEPRGLTTMLSCDKEQKINPKNQTHENPEINIKKV